MKHCLIFYTVLAVAHAVVADSGSGDRRFPDNFLFGAASAAYQIEGGWNASDKGESIWDYTVHLNPDFVSNRDNGDVACDSYNLYQRDVEMLKFLDVDFYRFSISWPRLLPSGFANTISEDGVRYYNALIDELLAHNITPVITLYHWDLPQSLQILGGWANPMISNYFRDYADVVFDLFGDRVKTWLTFNEPQVFCEQGYGRDIKAPAVNMSGIADYLCGHTMLLAHAKAYHLYNDNYRYIQKGRIGLTLSANWREPSSSASEDIVAAEFAKEFEVGWFAHPIFSKDGDYPKLFKDRISQRSKDEGYPHSRLPKFTSEEIKYIRGTHDFFGVNHYTTTMERDRKTSENIPKPSYDNDKGTDSYADPSWSTALSSWLNVVPWGFRYILNWIKDTYNNPEIIIFENGYSDNLVTEDHERISFYKQYLISLLDAIDDGCNVTGYTMWSLMDNFEWQHGYEERFGIFYVNYSSPNRERIPKESAYYYKNLIKEKSP